MDWNWGILVNFQKKQDRNKPAPTTALDAQYLVDVLVFANRPDQDSAPVPSEYGRGDMTVFSSPVVHYLFSQGLSIYR